MISVKRILITKKSKQRKRNDLINCLKEDFCVIAFEMEIRFAEGGKTKKGASFNLAPFLVRLSVYYFTINFAVLTALFVIN